MPLVKTQAEGINLADTFAFTGTVSGDNNSLVKVFSSISSSAVSKVETDWTQNRDVTLSNDAEWKTYRQALRDITTQTPSDDALSNIKFPTKPS